MTPPSTTLASIPNLPWVIYSLVHKESGKRYVGQTRVKLKARMNGHKAAAINKKSDLPIHNAIRKYGLESFHITILQQCCGQDCMDEAEKWWIAHFDCIAPNGYNLTHGGRAAHPAKEVVERMTAFQRSRPPVAAISRQRMAESQRGRRHSEETKRKMSAWQVGRKRPEISGPKHPLYGKHQSEEVKRKLSEARIRFNQRKRESCRNKDQASLNFG